MLTPNLGKVGRKYRSVQFVNVLVGKIETFTVSQPGTQLRSCFKAHQSHSIEKVAVPEAISIYAMISPFLKSA